MKVTVIGAGVVGITTAYFLRKHGIEVTVIERSSGPAQGGASYGNGGYYQASVPDPWNAPGALKMFIQAWRNSLSGKGDSSAFSASTLSLPGLFGWGRQFLSYANADTFHSHLIKNRALAQYSLSVVRDLNEQETLDYSWSNTGGLIVFRDAASLQGYADVVEQVREHGAQFEILDRDALLAKEPALSEVRGDLHGAVYFPNDQGGDSRVFCEQMAAIATSQGVEFVFDTAAERIDRTANGYRVRTAGGDVDADTVVVTAGVHSKTLLKPLGISLPIAPAKGYSLSIPMGDWATRPRHVIADMGTHAGVNPLASTLRVAGTAEFCGLRQGVSAKRTAYLVDLVRQLFPSFADAIDPAECDPWGGHRPLSADGIPMIGETALKGLYVNTGHGGLGWTQAPGSSKALADQIAGVSMEFDPSDFSIGRFN